MARQEQEFDDNNKEQMEKAKMNLVYVGMFSVFMLFAGLSSAYIVSMGDSFWLKAPFPTPFWISTALIIVSSILLQVSISAARKGSVSTQRMLVVGALILGIGFTFFQFKGYGELIDRGIMVVNPLIVTDGRYGDYFEIKKGEDFVGVNGNDYLINDKKMTDAELEDLKKFTGQFLDFDETTPFNITNYGEPYTLLFHSKELVLKDGKLQTKEGEELQLLDCERLFFLARNIRDGRGDFFARGEVGKDFKIYYKGDELHYKDRELHRKGKKLSAYLRLKAMESPDSASSYLYIITFVHLLHVIITVLFLLRAVIHSFTGRINTENTIGLRMTTLFWHFLGVLWLYLLLFLLFIH